MAQTYRNAFRNIAMTFEDGVLEMRLHTAEGPLKWGAKNHESVHGQLGEAFYRISRDAEVKVLILTGTGDEFLTGLDPDDSHEGAMDVHFWDRMAREGRDILNSYLDVGAIVISAVNGPATFHAELPTLADIVIASDTAVFADPHMSFGAVPGDGVHVWWPMLLGPNRGRSFLLTGEQIDAHEGKRLGFVTEVVPLERTLARAWEIARQLARNTPITLRNTRLALTQEIKRRMLNDLQLGFTLEGMAALGTH